MCGATDCRSCGPAQGYEVRRVWDAKRGGWKWINPEDEDEPDEDYSQDEEGPEDVRIHTP